MAMIRQADLDTSPRAALVMNVEDIRAQADSIMERTRAAAAAVMAEAASTRERIMAGAAEEGRAKGYAQGLATGLAEGRERGRVEAAAEFAERLKALDSAWNAALAQFIAIRGSMLRDCETSALGLAIAMGERVARRAISVDRRSVLPQVAALLDMATRTSRLTLMVNPADESLVREAMPGLLSGDPQQRHVSVVADGAVAVGSCMARTQGGGVLDATAEARLRSLIDEMLPDVSDATPALVAERGVTAHASDAASSATADREAAAPANHGAASGANPGVNPGRVTEGPA